MSDLQVVGSAAPFRFGELAVRVIDRDGDAWFVAKDACRALGIVWKGADSTGPLAEMEDDERGRTLIETAGGRQEMVVVSESGLYALIFKSRKAEAVRFRRWVTAEVLPAIRRTGRFAAAAAPRLAGPASSGPMWNPITGRAWGVADLALLHAAGRASPDWATRSQWRRAGFAIPPGAQPVLVWFTRGTDPGVGANTFAVFNREQVDKLP